MKSWFAQVFRTTAETLLACWIVSFSGSKLCASENLVMPAMVGHWSGNARIIVTWCQQTNLPVTLEIRADGTVTGKVGDAILANGQLKKNRGWLGGKLNVKTDYIIRGKLRGPIVATENISRSAVSMPLNFTGAAFVGGVHSAGSMTGGKERMILSASSLTLMRTNSP